MSQALLASGMSLICLVVVYLPRVKDRSLAFLNAVVYPLSVESNNSASLEHSVHLNDFVSSSIQSPHQETGVTASGVTWPLPMVDPLLFTLEQTLGTSESYPPHELQMYLTSLGEGLPQVC
jgi:hypothetical protein